MLCSSQAGITKVARKAGTVVEPFNLTKPRPRRIPEPMRIDNDVKVGSEPTYLDDTSLSEIEAIKRENLEEVSVS